MALDSKLKAGAYLVKSYVTAMPRVIYRATFSLMFDPKGTQKFVHQILNAQDIETDDPILGSRDITELMNGGGDIQITGPYYARRSSDTRLLMELACLAYLAQNLHPKLIFEIGTFVGRTTRLLAVNIAPNSQIVTLDLPQEQVKQDIGVDYRNTTEASRIRQVYGDSRFYDFSAWHGKCDFVWVDACHDYDFVVSDTRNALNMCRPGGWIGWHDYRHTAWWSGVTRAVRELRFEYPGLRHVRGTTMALLKKPEKEDKRNE
ncbi:MAG: class I SAM-dependent methyltransferase [Candidatus Omnitrophica bacterium]|nr:class I SAM-dependent methyltransferase [Candidatus Omnitrophota bacterium]